MLFVSLRAQSLHFVDLLSGTTVPRNCRSWTQFRRASGTFGLATFGPWRSRLALFKRLPASGTRCEILLGKHSWWTVGARSKWMFYNRDGDERRDVAFRVSPTTIPAPRGHKIISVFWEVIMVDFTTASICNREGRDEWRAWSAHPSSLLVAKVFVFNIDKLRRASAS